jgi:hypothetical protein
MNAERATFKKIGKKEHRTKIIFFVYIITQLWITIVFYVITLQTLIII